MKFSDITLPSNRKFGLFFTLVFLLFSAYFFQNKMVHWQKFIGASLILLLLSILLQTFDAFKLLMDVFRILLGRIIFTGAWLSSSQFSLQ